MANNNSISSIKAPPVLCEETGYERYKLEIEIWQLLKVCSKQEEGPLIFRTLPEKAKSTVISLGAAAIGSETGLQQILAKLDTLYLSDKNQRIFQALDAFEKFRRPGTMDMNTFVLEFQKLHDKVSQYNCVYPDGVLAYRILKAANISTEHESLVRATVETGKWSSKSIIEQLSKVFNVSRSPSPSVAVKVEPVFHSRTEFNTTPVSNEHFEINRSQPTIYDDYESDDAYCNQTQSCESSEYDIYYTPAYARNQNKWKRPSKPNFQRPQGYQSVRYIDDPSLRAGLRSSYNNSKTVLNPKDSRGNFTTCRHCRSIYHWVEDCPHLPDNKHKPTKAYYGNTTEEQIYIGLFQSNTPISSDEISCLLGETLDMAVIDSGCPKTVAGQSWFNEYLKSRSDLQDKDLQYLESTAIFRFGDSDPISASKKVLLPLNIANKNIFLETELVPANVPLLLSKETMKKANAKLNFDSDTISLFGVEQSMVCTSSGHYAIPIKKNSLYNLEKSSEKDNIVMFTLKEGADVKTVARKLHLQFSHPTSDRLIKLVKSSGIENSELIDEIKNLDNQCDTCKRFKKKNPRPVVCLPMSTDFNDTIAMDLKTFKNNEIYLLHMIDHCTRFSAGSVIRSKKKEVIVNELFKHWVSVFGAPRRILTDNGGEFANSELIDMCENLNINLITTAAESPWSNGLVEKHNGIIGEAISKILEDVDCSIEVALAWALNAKNSLKNIHGFSSYQLVFGKNPNLPSVFENKLPALEGITSSKLIASHLNAMHKAREEYIKLESSEKLRRAMRSKTRTHSNVTYFHGDEVFYKREEDTRWRGPGRVIGQDGSKILIKIPTGLISAHSSSVILTSDSEKSRTLNLEKSDKNKNSKIEPSHSESDEDIWYDADEEFGEPEIVIEDVEGQRNDENESFEEAEENTQNEVEEERDEFQQSIVLEHDNNLEDEVELPQNETSNIDEYHRHQENVADLPDLIEDDHEHINSNEEMNTFVRTVKDLPKVNQCVQFRPAESNEWKNIKIVGRGGKMGVKGKGNKLFLNVRDLNSSIETCENFEVGEWRPIEYQTLLSSFNDEKFAEAKAVELGNWAKLEVYEEVEDEGQNFVTTRWVLTEKMKENEVKQKARLVCRGYEDDSNVPTDSPTCNKDSLKTAIAIIASKEWEIASLDIKAAFLQGKLLEREIYMKPPKEASALGKLWKLRRCVYGLNDASRYWYLRLREELIKLGCKPSKLDPSVFMFHINSELHGLLLIHVDDILHAGSDTFTNNTISGIRSTFKISSECRSAFKYLGIDVTQTKEGIYLTQIQYLNELQEIKIDSTRRNHHNLPLTEVEISELRSVIGKLNWMATETRPDLSFSVSQLSSCIKRATINDLVKANKIVRKCKQYDVHLFYPKLNLDDLKVRCYSDASFAKADDGGSQAGVYVELVSEDKTAAVSWFSKRIKRVVNDTMAAETLAMVEGIDAGFLVSALLSEILYNGEKQIIVEGVTDNRSLFKAAHSTKSVTERRLRIDLGIIREALAKDELVLNWVPTSSQLSDVLTKEGVDPLPLLSHIAE